MTFNNALAADVAEIQHKVSALLHTANPRMIICVLALLNEALDIIEHISAVSGEEPAEIKAGRLALLKLIADISQGVSDLQDKGIIDAPSTRVN